MQDLAHLVGVFGIDTKLIRMCKYTV
jgi:hypothetical protein